MPAFLADALTWPVNRGFITAIKTAQKFGIAPSVLMLKDRQPSDGWSEIDKKLAIAFQILEDETCGDCGVPIWIGHSEDEHVEFEVKSRICYSCAEIERTQETEANRKSKRKPTKGKKRFVSTKPTPDMPSREDYYNAEVGKISD